MSSPFKSIAPPGATNEKKGPPTFLERLSNALVYVIAFPFIAAFIAIKNVFMEQKTPHHSYYDKLPEQHLLGQLNGKENGHATASDVDINDGRPVAARTRSRKA